MAFSIGIGSTESQKCLGSLANAADVDGSALEKPSQPFYILNPKNAKYPFMALATIEYRTQPGFDIPQWISAHSLQLADWMVIYHQGGKAVVWKNGQTVNYAPPMPMAIPAKPKAK
jgi:hypothetical protein